MPFFSLPIAPGPTVRPARQHMLTFDSPAAVPGRQAKRSLLKRVFTRQPSPPPAAVTKRLLDARLHNLEGAEAVLLVPRSKRETPKLLQTVYWSDLYDDASEAVCAICVSLLSLCLFPTHS